MNANLNLQPVKDLALDVWDDLTRTRLAGVAIGLGLVLLVVTVLVLRPHDAPTPSAVAATPAAMAPAEDEISFVVPGDEPLKLADVELSAPRDPFLSLDGSSSDQTLVAAGEEMADAVMSTPAGGGSSDTTTVVSTDTTSSLMPLDDLSGASAPRTTTTTGGEPQADLETKQPSEPTDTPATDYSYTADIQFGLVDDLKRYATVQRLGLVPSRKNPLLMYLGVTEDHDTAVFMVDSRLSQGGEGRCVPKDDLCTFLELTTSPSQDEHHFRDADGNEYLLRLRRLIRTTASAGSLSGPSVSALDGSPAVVDGAR